MEWEKAEKILNEALANTVMEVDEENVSYASELNKAWNRGAKTMLNEALILFIRRDREEREAVG